MSSIVIVNLGTGNLRSVSKAVVHVAEKPATVSADPEQIRAAGHLILPGQGAIGTWVSQLELNPDLRAAVIQRLHNGPVLGICLGLQALYEYSDENGGTPCLGVLEGRVRHFADSHRSQKGDPGQGPGGSANHQAAHYKIPHMGWNQVKQTSHHPLWHGINDGERFYFVHSYYAQGANSDEVAGQCSYGNEFTAAAARENIFATQFHPEKSQQAGLRLLHNFINWNGVH